jgi:hypothetical protein
VSKINSMVPDQEIEAKAKEFGQRPLDGSA